jgi:hypothetical protein
MDSLRGSIRLPAVAVVRLKEPRSPEWSRRSAASSSRRKPPESLVFFVDRSLGRKKVPEVLRAASVEIRVHDELFLKGRRMLTG